MIERARPDSNAPPAAPAAVVEEDAFERAAAELRPEWLGETEGAAPAAALPPATSLGRASTPPGIAFEAEEPSVIVQADIAALMERSVQPDPAFAQPAPAASVASGFGVPSAFDRRPSTARHEATVVTRAPPQSAFRALTKTLTAKPSTQLDAQDALAEGESLAAQQRKRKLRLAVIAAAACIALGVLIALVSGSSEPQPAAVAPAVAPVAPVVQPLPAATPVLPSTRGNLRSGVPGRSATDVESARSAPAAGRGPLVSKPAAVKVPKKKLAPAPVVRAPAKLLGKPVAKAPLKAAPAKSTPVKAAPAKAAAAKAAPAKGKAPLKGKAPPVVKRERSPVDVLNPWAN